MLLGNAALLSIERHASKIACAKKSFIAVNIANTTGHWNYGWPLKMTICGWYVVSARRTNSLSLSLSFSGSIIRCMRRLEELLRQMCQAAKAIGNTELENKFATGKTCSRLVVWLIELNRATCTRVSSLLWAALCNWLVNRLGKI